MNTTPDRFEELYKYDFEDLSVGMMESYSHTITETDVRMYAAMSGDTNPVHLDDEFASNSRFGGRIAHGFIPVGFFSALFGTRLPGPGAIYVSQKLRFKAPIMIGDTIVAKVVIKDLVAKKRIAVFDTICTVGSKVVIKGEAEIYIPARG
jgi:3-hydroxybutyryl-CoA dehydratase